MTDAELSALEAAAKVATRGPWSDEHNYYLDRHYVNCRNDTKEVCECQNWCEENIDGEANAAFIAAANPAAVLDLIAELRQARAERDWLARQLAKTRIFRAPYRLPMTAEQWLKLAKESACPKN